MLTNSWSVCIGHVKTLLRKTNRGYRSYRPDISCSARNAQHCHKWETALAGWEDVIARFPRNLNARIQYGTVLIRMGYFKKAEIVFRKAAELWPKSSSPLAALARVSQAKRDYKQACELWQTVSDAFPTNLKYLAAYIRSLLKILEFDKALQLYTDTAKKAQDPIFMSVLAEIHSAEYNWSAALNVLQALHKSEPHNIKIHLKEANFLLKRALKSNKPDYFNPAIEFLEQMEQTFTWNLQQKLNLAKAYIYVHRYDDADQVIKEIPNSFDTHKKVMELHAWQFHHYGDEQGAKLAWNQLLQLHYIPVVHSRINSLKRIDNNALEIKPYEILLFTTIHNELWRMQWFLEYYRKLGIDHFFIIDNASDDGTSEFMLQQKDVHLFWTEDSYAQAYSGMRWINELIELYGQENWCLYVDVDEALVFPGVEKFGLHQLTKYMERNGHEALSAFMLDMYAHDSRQQTDWQSNQDFTVYYPYFDNNYNIHGNFLCPYKRVTGGIRSRIFKISDIQTKIPLIRGGKNIKFLSSCHTITPAVLSDVTAVLRHYKMAEICYDHYCKENAFASHMPGSQQRYSNYIKILQGLGKKYNFISKYTKRYENSKQLIKLGLIKCPEAFLESAEDNLTDPIILA